MKTAVSADKSNLSNSITVASGSIQTANTADLAPIISGQEPTHHFKGRALSTQMEAKFLAKAANSDLFAPVQTNLQRKRKSSVDPSMRAMGRNKF